MKPSSLIIALLMASASITACGSSQSPDAAAKQEEKSVITKAVSEAVVEAREEIRKGNITISEHEKNLPKAEITPKGDLLIAGKAVEITPDQRALLLEYREHIAGVAESGMKIGVQGADLATKAMGEAFKGIFSGKSEKEIEQSVEAEAAKIKMAAAELCGRLPAMMASQQKVAVAVPEFKPYATMTQDDIDDCFKDSKDKETASMNAAEEAAAAAEKPSESN
jgi:hypothetical protein